MALEHGGRAAFRQPFCPDPVCVAARERRNYNGKRLRVLGIHSYVDAEPARKHVLGLLAAGMSRSAIAALASERSGVKVHRTQVRNLTVGQPPHQGPARRLRPETAAALLMVTRSHSPALRSGLQDATGTRRRIEALNVIGYHDNDLARRIGMSSSTFAAMRRRAVVLARTAQAVKDVYTALCGTPGPGVGTRANRDKFVDSCRAKGFLSPIWWDEDNIDDPSYLPDTSPEACQGGRPIASTIEDSEFLRGHGVPLYEITTRMGYRDPETLYRMYLRARVTWPFTNVSRKAFA